MSLFQILIGDTKADLSARFTTGVGFAKVIGIIPDILGIIAIIIGIVVTLLLYRLQRKKYNLDIEYLESGALPDQLQVYLRDEITKIYLRSWCDKIGSYETSHRSIQQVPYGYTAG